MSTVTESAIKSEYPKIETIFNRNPENMRHVVMGDLRWDEFGLVDRWLVTEKIHGTNVRVAYEDGIIRFGGRSDDAQMPIFLLDTLREMFTVERFAEIWPVEEPDDEARSAIAVCPTPMYHDTHRYCPSCPWQEAQLPHVVLYGEGYGAKIQKGGSNYRSNQSFRLFDVVVRGVDRATGQPKWWWLEWDNVIDVALKLDLLTVPVIEADATTAHAISLVGGNSEVAMLEGGATVAHEGIVCRTVPQLFTRNGRRLMWKLKGSDIPEEA